MSTLRNLLITAGLTVGLIAGGGATALAATPAAAGTTALATVAAVSPLPANDRDHDDNDYGDRRYRDYHHRDYNYRDRDYRDFRYRWTISSARCIWGGGHVDRRDYHRCEGGRYNNWRVW